MNYSYLADGTKTSSLKPTGEGLVYRGPFTYRRDADGTMELESAVCPEGRLTPGKALLYVTDHLGSVRYVIDGNTGSQLERSDYTAYGTRSGSTPSAGTGLTFRDHFTGQEDQMPDFSVPYSDHGARHYNHALHRWMVPDPLSEKYYGQSPYNYCNGNPMSFVDLDGRKIIIGSYSRQFSYELGQKIPCLKEKDSYVEKVWSHLKQLQAMDSALNDAISTIDNSITPYLILPASEREFGKGNGYSSLSNTLYYDPDNDVSPLPNEDIRDPKVGLAHEVGHAQNDENNTRILIYQQDQKDLFGDRGPDKMRTAIEKYNKNEANSIRLENVARYHLDLNQRSYNYLEGVIK